MSYRSVRRSSSHRGRSTNCSIVSVARSIAPQNGCGRRNSLEATFIKSERRRTPTRRRSRPPRDWSESLTVDVCRCDPWVEGRVTLGRCKDHDDRTHSDPGIKVDHVLIGHPDASRRNSLADMLRLIGAVNAEEGVLATCIQIQAACPHRIMRPAVNEIRNVAEAPLDIRRRRPAWPLLLATHFRNAVPGQGLLADRH